MTMQTPFHPWCGLASFPGVGLGVRLGADWGLATQELFDPHECAHTEN